MNDMKFAEVSEMCDVKGELRKAQEEVASAGGKASTLSTLSHLHGVAAAQDSFQRVESESSLSTFAHVGT